MVSKRLVRLHFTDKTTTIEGIRVNRWRPWAGQYVLIVAQMLEAADRTHDLDGKVRVDRDKVLFIQELR